MTAIGGRDGKVRWGILATGSIAATVVKDLKTMPDAEVIAVGSRRPESAKHFADRFEIPRAYGNWSELAADDEVDVVYVATPHSAHHSAARLCLEAGRAVLCEKPLTLNTREAGRLVELARARRRFLMEAMWMYCNPVVRRMVELVRGGAIGQVRAVHADFGLAGPVDPAHRLRDPALGGGALLDLGVYPVALAQLLLGEPAEVQGWAKLTPEGVDENTGALLSWDSGAVAVLSCSITADTAGTAVVTGSAGRIEFPRGFFHAERFVLHRPDREPEEFGVPGQGYRPQAAEVMRCLRAGETESPLVPLDGTVAVIRTLDALRARVGVRYPGEA